MDTNTEQAAGPEGRMSGAVWAVTGANGYVGHALCHHLQDQGAVVRAVVRSSEAAESLPGGMDTRVVPEYEAATLEHALDGADVVVHLAGSAHGRERTTTAETLAGEMVAAASRARVRRMLFVSSVKAQVGAAADGVVSEIDPLMPQDSYGHDKLAAERVVATNSAGAGMEYSIVRPTLVYGPDPRGHLGRLLAWLAAGRPLPLGGVNNRRSMVSLEALCRLLVTCGLEPAAAGRTYLAADPDPVSTADLAHSFARGLGREGRVFSVPAPCLRAALVLSGRGDWSQRLAGNLEVSSRRALEELNWSGNPDTVAELERIAGEYALPVARGVRRDFK